MNTPSTPNPPAPPPAASTTVAVARIVAATVSMLALLATICVLALTRADQAILITVGSVFGAAMPMLISFVVRGGQPKDARDGKSDPPPAAGSASVVLAAVLSGVLNGGCSLFGAGDLPKLPPAVVERQKARAAVEVAGVAVVQADAVCAGVVHETKDRELGAKCDAVYAKARNVLVAAAISVDTWDEASSRADVTCSVADVVHGLAEIHDAMQRHGAQPLPAVQDAVALAAALGQCPRMDGGA